MRKALLLPAAGLLSAAGPVWAESQGQTLNLIHHPVGYLAIAIFVAAYILVMMEEKIHLRKSKPMLLAAGLIWVLLAIVYRNSGAEGEVEDAIRHNFLEYAELFFFLLVAMTYINAMLERGVFDQLRIWLLGRGYGYRRLFWITGTLAFFISPVADNLTTALIMCAVVMAVGRDSPAFVSLSCINIVVGANAGGAFSPFGDITTLMVWQKGILPFQDFFQLFLPSVVNFLIPAFLMHWALPKGYPMAPESHDNVLRPGGLVICGLFLATIVTAISFHQFLHIPPVFGMMTGLAYLKLFGYFLRRQEESQWDESSETPPGDASQGHGFDVFAHIARSEWDTLFFFYGVILAVGGLGFIGYLGLVSNILYVDLGPTAANVMIGLISALVDNIPVMFAVLTMNPDMPDVQWLLVTLTAGVGGSLLSIGSAAGVALMGQARGQYTFFSHLKWTPAIALGYGASIWVHFLVNG
ncbi:sodium/proton antiporter, NhaD family [Marinobacter daqiaonensis]|uniref:Sodium/proton antiporter, NhaD family n=1 Tax=Marinobacter daqiaonensis TaxID=650891 RepID=A0A1I6HQY1_9GAMM|nr:sodium:proton antiporter NhaD [Marinobacter daqiaonensis]SFR56855.1 sodium/proton antiporter, NhaD family [Marinobacter daqiaonensis]